MYNPQELQRNAQLNLRGVDTQARTTIDANPSNTTEASGVVKGLATAGNFITNILRGAIKSIEGIVDAGAMISGLFGADVDDFVEWDITSDIFGVDEEEGRLDWAWGKSLENLSYIDNDNIVNQVAEGVGGMLPMIAVNLVPGVGQALSTAMFVGSAGGSASERALQEDANYWQALGYGAVSGAIEGATEMIGGRMFGATSGEAVGKTLLGKSKAIQKLVGNKVGRVAYNFASEGVEEVLSDILDPVNKRVFGITDTIEMPSLKDLGKTFVIGGTIGQILDGAQTGVRALKNSKNGGKHFVNMSNNLQDIVNTHKALAVIQGNTKVSQERMNSAIVRSSERTLNDLEDMSNELKAMSNEQRENALKILGDNSPYIREMFENDGTLKDDAYTTYNEIIKEGGKGYNVSTNLMYSKEYLDKKMQEVSAERHEAVEVSTTNLNEKQRKNFAKITRATEMLGKKTNQKMGVVLVKQNVNSNTTLDFISGDTIYINERHLENGEWASYLSHEITHFAKDSKEFKGFAEFALKDKSAVANALSKIVSNYDFSLVDVENLRKKIGTDQKMTDTELEIYDELIAHLSEELFTSEKSIELLARENTTLAQKILNKIKDFLSLFKGTNANRETVQRLRKAELLLENALKSIGKETESIERNTIKATKNYLKDKKEYESLEDSEKEKWLKERGYKKEDFDKDVYVEKGNNRRNGLRYSIKLNDNVETEVTKTYGKTYNWSETGYILNDGTRLDLSGKNQGASGGRRTIDHRDIFDSYEDVDGTDAMIAFMARGNIRVSPEYPGINIQVEPNAEQYRLIQDLVERLGWKQKYFSVDFDNKYGEVVETLNYEGNVSGRKVVSDIKYYFKEGKLPYQSELSKFRYSVKPSEYKNVMDNLNDFKTIDELKSYFSTVQSLINEDARNTYPRSMKEINEIERNRVQKVIEASNLEKEAIKKYRSLYAKKPKVSLDTKTQIDAIDKKYTEALKSNDLETAKYLVEQMAILKGYAVTDYQIDHKAPTNDGYNARLDDVSSMYGEDIYGKNAERYFGTFEGFDNESIRHIQESKNKPNSLITVYRAVPASVKGNQIRNGDWITLTYDYAKNHGESNIIGNYRVIKKKVKISEIFTDGNSIHEFGYDDGKQYYYGNTENYRKLADIITFDDNGNPIRLRDRFNYRTSDVRYSVKINADMTDSERYDILKDKKIENIPVAKELTKDQLDNIQGITSFEDLNKYFGAEKRSIIKKIASEFGVFKEYYNKDIELEFEFSKSNYNESYQKQKHNFVSYAKMFSVFDAVVEKAVGIEVHNRNIKNYKEDQTLKNVYVLASAFIDDQSIVPVKLEIKEFNDKNNKLYVAIALDKIKKTEVLEDRAFLDKEVTHSSLSVNISIRDLLKNVNPNDKDFYKYIPKQFFEEKNRYSIKPNENTKKVSEGQIQKKVADISMKKVYSKKESQEIVNSIIGNVELGGGDYVLLRNNSMEQIADKLWKVMNTYDAGKRVKAVEKIADYIIDNALIDNVFRDEQNQADIETIEILKPYLHKLNLDNIKDEIKHRYGKTNASILLWGKRKNESGLTADQVAKLLKEEGIQLESINEADLFFELDKLYRDAVKNIKDYKKQVWNESLSEEERKSIRTEIRNEILRAFDSNGSKSKLTKVFEETSKKAKFWRDLYYEVVAREKAVKGLLSNVKSLKGLKEFQNATQFNTEQFKGSIEKLGKLDWRGNLNESGARKICETLNSWYTKTNEIVGDKFDAEVSELLDNIANGKGKLTSNEIRDLANVVAYFKHFVETSNKIYENGKWVNETEIATNYIAGIKDAKNLKVGNVGKVLEWAMKGKYMENFADPMALARYMDRYNENGFYTKTFESFRMGTMNSALLEMELNAPVIEFLDNHKHYLKRLQKETINYRGVEMSVGQAISLYMTLNREQAVLGFVKSGIVFKNNKGETIRLGAIETDNDLTFDEYKEIALKEQSELGKLLSENDLAFIKVVEKIFNEDCKNYKKERDMQLRGYTNILDDYYFPIKRAYTRTKENENFFGGDRVGNESFNKTAIKGAQQELEIDSIDNVFTRHVRGIAQYYHLANVIQNFEVLYNLDVSGNKNAPTSVKTESANLWKNGENYIEDIKSDIQGIKKGKGNRVFGFLRKGFASFQLGANPKVWLSQLSSLFASSSILDYGSLIKGFTIKANDVDKYCDLAKLRNANDTAIKSVTVSENIGKVGEFFGKPIGAMDRLVVKRLFASCQVQVQKDYGLKIGTEENKVKAGELLTKVIFETQQNSLATERSKAMRSSSEFMKGVTMFTADAMKVGARVIDSYGKISVIKARIRMTTDAKELERLKKELKSANKQAIKSTVALVMQASFMALLAEAFKKFYNRDEDEEKFLHEFGVDFLGNMIGGLPIIKDLYSKLMEGYDFNSFAFESVNDLFEAIGSLSGLASGDSRQVAQSVRKLSYAIGQLWGIPFRNIYNVFYGTSNLVSPSFAYKVDDFFYKQSYSSDLSKAISKGDDDMIETIAGLMTKENIGAFGNSNSKNEITRLAGQGFDVLPQSVGTSMTINETQYTLTDSQKRDFKEVYSGAISSIDKLVSTNGYKVASDEAKAKAIKYIYKYYYYEAQQKTLNVELDNKLFLFGQIISIDKMALALAQAPLLAEKSSNKKLAVERYLQGLKLTATEKYLLMSYFGYKNTKGESYIKNAVNRSSLSKAQKNLLLEKCGF